eukprot:TRINITY_DN2554_c0_g1_i1.p1 TRINITY_DN2554_c0_g1~~TRINITY_DN2554_c0_g1_i1.p1  ORF type:complete len:422 (+),score=160.89 TRINITY_DN2554_c0_g1_i1:96-1361(+)
MGRIKKMESNILEQILDLHRLLDLGFAQEVIRRAEAILAKEENYDVYLIRGTALARLNRITEAIEACEAAIILDSANYQAFYKRGLFNFQAGNLKAALIDLDAALSKVAATKIFSEGEERQKIEFLKGKANFELARQKSTASAPAPAPAQAAPAPAPAPVSAPQPTSAPQPVNVPIPSSGPQKLSSPNSVPQNAPIPVKPVPASQAMRLVTNASGRLLYSWHQNNDKVYIFIREKLPSRDVLKTNITEKRLEVSYARTDSSTYELGLDLAHEVLPNTAVINVHFEEVEIQLEKKEKNKNWLVFEAGAEEQTGPAKVDPNIGATPAYPSSSKVKRDWSKIDHDIEVEMKKNKEYEEGDPANAFFKELYAHADEETRKAMIKSYQTSGGTVLSTNWNEVKEKDYEGKDRPEAPAGQTWRKWEK